MQGLHQTHQDTVIYVFVRLINIYFVCMKKIRSNILHKIGACGGLESCSKRDSYYQQGNVEEMFNMQCSIIFFSLTKKKNFFSLLLLGGKFA